ISVGEAISASALPAKSEQAIDILRRATLSLGGRHAPHVSIVSTTRKPSWTR
ncbi:unnamed protein product, partial [Ectocarpus sp. 12 AP-2014]